jgi:sarcosine oxidase
MGSAALAHLAVRGKRVIGFERFSPAHAMGSSHGDSRMIRRPQPIDARYVPLVLRAYELWRDLEAATGVTLLRITGGLFLGRPQTKVFSGAVTSVREHEIPHEIMDAPELRRRFPALAIRDDELALFDPEAGIVFPESGILAHLQYAIRHGAEARFGTPVRTWTPTPEGVRVTTAAEEIVEADHLVIAAGAWFGDVCAELGFPLQVERNVMHYFAAKDASAEPMLEALPVYIVERDEGRIYGFPSIHGHGLKAAFYRSQHFVSPETVERTVNPSESLVLRSFMEEFIPSAAGALLRSRVCLYTLTPNEDFILGPHPLHPQIILAGAFSGHGYKFCGVVGEIIANLITHGSTPHPIALFDPRRYAA